MKIARIIGILAVFCFSLLGCGSLKVDSGTATFSTPSITVLSPNGGESWKVGETHRISWESNGIQNVIIYLYDNRISGSGAIVNYPEPNNQPVSANKGYYDWTILPNVLQANDGKNFQIIIQDANNYQLSDQSDAAFNLVAADGQASP